MPLQDWLLLFTLMLVPAVVEDSVDPMLQAHRGLPRASVGTLAELGNVSFVENVIDVGGE